MSEAGNSRTSTASSLPVSNVSLGVLLFGIFSIAALFTRPLLPIDETRYLTVAWEMWQSGNYFVPTLNGEIYSHKPPLLFWFINIVWSLTGVSEISARLIGPFAGIATILLTARIADILWPEREEIAGRSALILSTSGLFLLFASLTMFDALLAVGALISVLGLLKFEKNKSIHGLLIFSFGLAFGVLAKGPVIFLHVLPVAILLFAVKGSRWQHSGIRWFVSILAGIIAAAFLVFLWLVPALIMGGPDYQEAILWTQTAGRITKSFAHQKPFWFFIALFPALLWPWLWSPFVWSKERFTNLLKDRNGLMCCLWFLIVFVLFSLISGKQIHYLIPALPVLALILGYLFEETRLGLLSVGIVVLPALILLTVIALLLTGEVPARGAQYFFSPVGIVIIACFTAGMLIYCWLYSRSFLLFAILAPVTLLAVHTAAIEPMERLYDNGQISQLLHSRQTAGIAIIGRKYQGEFNFSGRLNRPIDVLKGKSAIAPWIKSHPGGAVIGLTDRETPTWQPQYNFPYRNRSYAIWLVPKEQSK